MKKSISTFVPLLIIPITLFFILGTLQQTAQAAALTVTKTTDTNDGSCNADCSLREAIGAASNGDTIHFANSLSGMTLTLQTAVSINKVITIDGSTLPLSATIAMSGGEKMFATSSTVVIDSLTFKNGLTEGAIHNTGNLTINNAHFENNEVASGNGGAINNEGILIIDQSTFINNRASNRGGAIYNKLVIVPSSPSDTRIQITNSTFDQNSSLHGGAIFNDFDIEYTPPIGPEEFAFSDGANPSSSFGFVEIHESTISNNSAAYNGGGIANFVLQKEVAPRTAQLQSEAGADLFAYGIVYISKSNIMSNTAVSHGGGIHNTVITPSLTAPAASPLGASTFDGYSAVKIEQTTIANNNANYGAGIANTTPNICELRIQSPTALPADNIVVELSESLIENNNAIMYGGGLFMGDESGSNCNPNPATPNQPDVAVSRSTFVNNSASQGGGAYNENGRVVIGNSTFSANIGAQGAAIVNHSQTELWHTTIYTNAIVLPPPGNILETNGIGSGSVYNSNEFTIFNSIIAGTNGPATEDCVSIAGIITGANNIILAGTSCITPEITVDPNLHPLSRNGYTFIHAISEDSSAVDAAGVIGCGHYLVNYQDQQGFPRPTSSGDEGGLCDIGAVEYLLNTYLPLVLKN